MAAEERAVSGVRIVLDDKAGEADSTKGVKINGADKVSGKMLWILNTVSGQTLKVYPPAGGVINGGSADAAVVSAAGRGICIVCLSAGSNIWATL